MTFTHVRMSLAAALAAVLATALSAFAQPSGPKSIPPPGIAASDQIPMLREVGIDQKINAPIPMDVTFSDETGREVPIGRYFGEKPVVMAFVYYECPMICTQVLNGLVGSLEGLSLNADEDFEVVIVSFDPGETPALAADTKRTMVRRYGRPETADGWHFLTGREANIKRLTDAVGFRYAYDEAIDQYAHPAAILVATPDGRVGRYLYGIEFAPIDLRLALSESTEGRVGTAIDQALLLTCYTYDPETGKYGFVVMNLVRAAGILTLLVMGGAIFLSLRRERRRNSAVGQTATGTR